MSNLTMDKLVALCKSRGFIYPGSEIYGGLANTWDYGPLGVEFKNNIKRAWWQKFVQESKYNVGLDAGILMNREVWVASGHVGGFNDPLMDCKACKARFRADKLIEDYTKGAETGDVFTPASKPCALARLGVLPDCQGRGYGKAMLCSMLHVARAQGYDAVRLLVGADNAPAIHLYEETGFIAVGETDAYDEHWLQMERLLTA